MIVLTRGLARRFRAVARKCLTGRPRGPAPPVTCRAAGGVLTLTAHLGDVVLSVSAPAPPGDAALVIPMSVLEAVDGAGDDPVELRLTGRLAGEARWADRGVPRSLAFDAVTPCRRHDPPSEPGEWAPASPGLLLALHECGRTAARDPGRFALDRVQVRGKPGRVVGTDGRVALVFGGFTLPFAGDVLVPAVPAFGCRELAGQADVRVGLAAGRLCFRTGPWTVWLAADPAGRYPDVARVVPAAAGAAACELADGDAADLLAALPTLPGADGDDRPVTLDLDGAAAVRATGPGGEVAEVRLPRSAVSGPPARVALDRAALARALRLGCRAVRLAGGGKPAVFGGPGVTLVAVPLDPSAVITPDPAGRVRAGPSASNITTPDMRNPMPPHNTNGRPANGHADPPPPADVPDPLAEAEALRAALADAAAKAGRLVAALKAQKREKKALTQVWAGLKSLNLGPQGGDR